MSSTIQSARDRVRRNVRDGNDTTTYPDVDIDNAIQEVGRRLCRQTRCLTKVSSVAITAASTAFPVTTPLSLGFHPERVIDCFLSGEDRNLRLVDWPTLNGFAARDTPEGMPELLAFQDATSAGIVWPTPDAAYTAKLRWWLPFTSWTAGDSSSNATTLNLPDELLDVVIRLGAPAMVKFPSAEKLFSSTLWQLYLAEEKRLAGAGRLGEQEQIREPSSWGFKDPTVDRVNAG